MCFSDQRARRRNASSIIILAIGEGHFGRDRNELLDRRPHDLKVRTGLVPDPETEKDEEWLYVKPQYAGTGAFITTALGGPSSSIGTVQLRHPEIQGVAENRWSKYHVST